MTENRFLGEMAIVAAMHPPSLVAADGTGCVRVRRRDTESQSVVVEVGADQATADRSAQKLGQEQRVPPREMRPVNQPRSETTYLRSWIIKSAGEPIRFPSTVHDVASMSIPYCEFPEMVLASPEDVPPIVAPVAGKGPPPTSIPTLLATVAPVELVPIRFPSTVHDVASMSMPYLEFPEMVLASPEAVPPIVVPVAFT